MYGRGPAMRLLDKTVEPVKRNKDGLQWIIHRFPIKGGISIMDAIHQDMRNQLVIQDDKFRGIPIRLKD
jgi:hypothetical protein